MSKRVEGERTSIRWVDGYLWVVEQREDNELWVPQKGFFNRREARDHSRGKRRLRVRKYLREEIVR